MGEILRCDPANFLALKRLWRSRHDRAPVKMDLHRISRIGMAENMNRFMHFYLQT